MHPGLHSIGQLAVVGIGLTLLAALVFLPALLQWFEERDGRRSGGGDLTDPCTGR
jgi:predicted RND superfamily exporter protein